MKKADHLQWKRPGALLVAALVFIACAIAACASPGIENGGAGNHPQTDFPITGYGYGNATHLLFSYDGPPELVNEWRRVSEKGIADDPRVQRFVDEFREVLAKRGFVREDLLWREEQALGYLDEPVYQGGFRLVDAEEITRFRNGKPEKYYHWDSIFDGGSQAGAFWDELPALGEDYSGKRWRFENTLRAVYGRPKLSGGYTDFLQLYVANSRVGFNATKARYVRNSEQFKYGVMGIVARADAKLPQALVQHVIVEISTQPDCPARTIDELIVEALNASLGDGEVVQFYPHAALNEFGDTDERVTSYMVGVQKAVLIKRPD